MSEGVTGGGGGERVRVCGGGESEGEELERECRCQAGCLWTATQPLSHKLRPLPLETQVFISPPELEPEPPNRVEVSESNLRIATGTYLRVNVLFL